MIKTTLTFCILKLISEQQAKKRTIPKSILLWGDWRRGQMNRDVKAAIDDLVALGPFSHLKEALSVDRKLQAPSCAQIHDEISRYTLYNSDFDFFGLVYEALANPTIKSDFGEFYTPRHLIKSIVRLRLNDEQTPRPLSICDPACGTGGFLVEAFLLLQEQYRMSKLLDDTVMDSLRARTFYGFDTSDEVSVPFARTNMMMADDGGINIRTTPDSLKTLGKGLYDYILANIPYGKYSGSAPIDEFVYARSRRYELLFLEKIVNALKFGGSAAVIVPDGLVENSSYARFRQRLLLDVTMEAVLSLHTSVFEPYTTEKTYVLFFTRRRQAERGAIQTEPIWHYIVDHDGFQKGKKRYRILENDLEEVEREYRKIERPGKCGFVPMSSVNHQTFYSLSCEYHLRRVRPVEVSVARFEKLLIQAEKILGTFTL
ncbi:MAG TPA: N-6 DNA methylase [Bryobacterales bacterium]|nr:N-6 DNA methylase [Bryobacterales bacterium]